MEGNYSRSGIGFIGLLQIVFIVLKLCGIINWSWFWVLAPLWIDIIVYLVILILVIIVAIIKNKPHKKEKK